MKKSERTLKNWLNLFTHKLGNLIGGRHEIRTAPAQRIHTSDSQPVKNVSDKPTELFVVWDAIGDGRLLGVFADEKIAEEIRQINPYYFRYYRCQINTPTSYELDWLDEKQKWQLELIKYKYALGKYADSK